MQTDVVEEHHRRNRFPRAPDPQRLRQTQQHSAPVSRDLTPRDSPAERDVVEQTSTSPGELSGSATKLRSYPYKFREIIERAKQFAQCGAATDPFPSQAWLIGEKCSEYIAEAIAEYEEKGVLIPPGEYYATVSLHSLTTDRVLASLSQRTQHPCKFLFFFTF